MTVYDTVMNDMNVVGMGKPVSRESRCQSSLFVIT